MKATTTIRRTWPQVRSHEVAGITYWLVDTRRTGISIPRKTFKTQDEALTYASEIAEKFSSEGKNGLAKVDFVMSDQVKKWTDQLTPYGKTVDDAVQFYVVHLAKEAKITKTVSEYLQEWMESKVNNKLAPMRPASITTLKTRTRFYQREFNGSLVTSLTKDFFVKWFHDLDVSNETRFNHKRYLTNFFNWMIDLRLITENPMKKIQIQRETLEIEIYTIDQLKEMAEKVLSFPELVGFFALCCFAGVRPNEARQLTWDNVNFEHGEIYIPPSIDKTKRGRMIYATKNGLKNLMEWLEFHKATGAPLIPEGFNPYQNDSKIVESQFDVVRAEDLV